MKQKFTSLRALILAFLIVPSTIIQAQTFDDYAQNFTFTFSVDGDPDLYDILNDAGETVANGHLSSSSSGTNRDIRYNNVTSHTPAVFTLTPVEDVYLAIKYIGSPTASAETVQFRDPSGWGSNKPAPIASITTTAGNKINYYAIAGNTSGDYTQATFDITSLNFFQRDITEPFTIDWIATFTSEADIQAAAALADDGASDFDESVTPVTWDGAAWSPSAPTADVPATLTGSYTGAGFTASSVNVDANNLTITSGVLDVMGDVVGTGTITIESGASLLTYDGSSVAPISIERNTNGSALGYSFVGTPVETDPSITGSDLGSVTWYYDETEAYAEAGGARWKDAGAMQLSPGVGYAQAEQSAISFTGVPNAGDITVAGLSFSAGTAGEQGWNLISNPYPAAISATAFIGGNGGLDAAIYLWDDPQSGSGSNADYLTINDLGVVNGAYNGYLGAMQGFFVKVAAEGTTDVTFTQTMRDAGNNADGNFFRKADVAPLNIKLAISNKAGLYNELLIGLRANASFGFDRLYDAAKFIGNSDIAFYSLINDSRYAIQGLPAEAGVSTELAFNLAEASTLELSVVELSGLVDGMNFYLHDKVTGKTYNLSEIESIEFAASAGSDQNRFTLSYGVADVLSNNALLTQPIYRYANQVMSVDFASKLDVAEYAVFDLSGRVLVKSNVLSQDIKTLEVPMSAKGINILRIVTSEDIFTRKFNF